MGRRRLTGQLVELGPIVDGLRVVRSGLAATDRIVIDGLQRARPGQKVKPEDGTIKPIPLGTHPELRFGAGDGQ